MTPFFAGFLRPSGPRPTAFRGSFRIRTVDTERRFAVQSAPQ